MIPLSLAALLLQVAYPELYPDVGPDLDISMAPGAPKPPGLDLATDKDNLLAALEPTIEESLGMAMVFNLVTTLKEAAEQLIAERASVVEQALEAEKRAEEEKEDAKFHGEKVTPESFLRWREAFRKEKEKEARRKAEEAEIAAKKGQKAAPVEKGEKLTGRQLWERGLVGKVDEEEEGDAVLSVEKGVEGLKVE